MTKNTQTGLIGIALCIPLLVLLSLLILNIEPNFGPLEPYLNNPNPNAPDYLGTGIALITFLLVVAAFILNMRALLSEKNLDGYKFNGAVAAISIALILLVLGGIVIDQYPCWLGVPNCD